MKLIDRLLMQAKAILTTLKFDFDTNEDEFLEALGVDPVEYRINYPGGEYGYDVLKALSDITPELWIDHDEEYEEGR